MKKLQDMSINELISYAINKRYKENDILNLVIRYYGNDDIEYYAELITDTYNNHIKDAQNALLHCAKLGIID